MTTQTTNGIDPSKAEQRAERAVQNVAEQDAAKNNTSLAVLSGKLVNFEPQSATETWLLAQYFFAAKSMLPARLGSVGDVFMTLMAGRSLGLDAMTAIRGIDCVEGKVFIEGDLVHAMLLSRLKAEDGEYVELIESTDKGATYEFMKKGWKKPKQGTFNEVDARAAGLLDKKGPWQSYRKAMFRHRAMVTWGREYFPQWFLGVYTTEEREEFGRDVNARPGAGVIPATKAPTEVDVAPTQPGPVALPAPSPKVHLEEAMPADVVRNVAPQPAGASAPKDAQRAPSDQDQVLVYISQQDDLQGFKNALDGILGMNRVDQQEARLALIRQIDLHLGKPGNKATPDLGKLVFRIVSGLSEENQDAGKKFYSRHNWKGA